MTKTQAIQRAMETMEDAGLTNAVVLASSNDNAIPLIGINGNAYMVGKLILIGVPSVFSQIREKSPEAAEDLVSNMAIPWYGDN
jgi:hypothetical protein